MSLAATLGRGAFFQVLATLLRGGASFLVTPFVIATLGTRQYGFWTMCLAFFGAYELFDFGISTAVSRHLAHAQGAGDRGRVRGIVGTALAIFCIFGGVIAAVAAVTAAVSPLFLDDPAEAALFRPVILVLGAGMAVSFPLRVFRGLLVSHVRYDLLNQAGMWRLLTVTGLTFAVLGAGHGILALAVLTVLGRLGESLAVIFFCRNLLDWRGRAAPWIERGIARDLFLFGGKAFVSQLADTVRFRIDAFVVAGFVGLEAVALYDVGQKFLQYGKELVQSALNVMTPVFSRYEGQKDYERIRATFLRLSKWGVVVAVFTGAGLVIFGGYAIERWVGPAFRPSYHIMVILCVPMVVELIQLSSIQVLYGLAKHHHYAKINVAEAAANLVLSVGLTKLVGVYGVALGTAVEIFVFKSYFLPVVTCREVGVPLRRYYGDVLLRTGAALLVPLTLFGLAVRPFMAADYGRVALGAAAQLLLFAPFVYYVVLDAAERALVLEALRGQRRRRAAQGAGAP